MLSGKEVLEKVLEHLGLTPAAFANKIGLSRLEDEYGYILNELDLKKEVYKLRQELEEIKKMLPGCK